MKTTKFLAMLLAAFALACSFASCGDDDDDTPSPNPPAEGTANDDGDTSSSNPPAEGTANVLKIGNKSTTINAASWEILDFNNDGELRYQCIELRGSNDAMIRIGFWAVTTSGVIPTGTYRLDERGDAAVYGGGRIGETGFNFSLSEAGNGSLVIKKVGDEYTVTIDPFVVNIQQPEQTVTTKLEYKGKIEIVSHYVEEPLMTIDGNAITGKYAYWSILNEHYTHSDFTNNIFLSGYVLAIAFCDEPQTSFYDLNENASTVMEISLRNRVPEPDTEIAMPTEVPTGVFPYEKEDYSEAYIYVRSSERAPIQFNMLEPEGVGLNDRAKVTIEKVGDEYKITSESLDFECYAAGDWDNKKQATATFSFQGQIVNLRHGE